MLTSIIPAVGENISDFELRKGLHFGSTVQDIMAAENLTQLSGDKRKVYGNIQFSGTIAGYEDAWLGYFLNSENKLKEMGYCFEFSSTTEGNRIFDNLLDLLIEKYGQPLEDAGGSYRVVSGTITKQAGPWQKCREWLLSDGDGFVKIDLTLNNLNLFGDYWIRFVWVDYTYFTSDEAEALLENANNEKQAVLDDL